MYKTVLRLPVAIAKAVKKDAETKHSLNSLIVEVLARRYGLPFDARQRRDHEKYFKNGELHGFILEILGSRKLSTTDLVDSVIEDKGFTESKDSNEVRASVRGIITSMSRKGLIVKVGVIGRAHLWRVNI